MILAAKKEIEIGDPFAKAKELEKRAEKKLRSWNIFGSKYFDAGTLYSKAATLYGEAAKSFKLTKSWNKAGDAYVGLANCYVKLDMKLEAAYRYVHASRCYKRSNIKEAITCLEQSINMFVEARRNNMTATYYEEIAGLCEQEWNFGNAIYYYDKAAEVFESGRVTPSANKCRQKVVQLTSQLEQ